MAHYIISQSIIDVCYSIAAAYNIYKTLVHQDKSTIISNFSILVKVMENLQKFGPADELSMTFPPWYSTCTKKVALLSVGTIKEA